MASFHSVRREVVRISLAILIGVGLGVFVTVVGSHADLPDSAGVFVGAVAVGVALSRSLNAESPGSGDGQVPVSPGDDDNADGGTDTTPQGVGDDASAEGEAEPPLFPSNGGRHFKNRQDNTGSRTPV